MTCSIKLKCVCGAEIEASGTYHTDVEKLIAPWREVHDKCKPVPAYVPNVTVYGPTIPPSMQPPYIVTCGINQGKYGESK